MSSLFSGTDPCLTAIYYLGRASGTEKPSCYSLCVVGAAVVVRAPYCEAAPLRWEASIFLLLPLSLLYIFLSGTVAITAWVAERNHRHTVRDRS